jgi:hypothetical protein
MKSAQCRGLRTGSDERGTHQGNRAVLSWNGRIYILNAFTNGIAGFYALWFRGTAFGSFGEHLAISINAVLIIVCAAMTLRYAVARKICCSSPLGTAPVPWCRAEPGSPG